MKRGLQCVARTISRSQSNSCSGPEQVRKLANGGAAVISPCLKLVRSPYASPRPVAIRVCTRRDIERNLRPLESCECSPRRRGLYTEGKSSFSRLVKNVAKSAVAAGLVYWTSVEGVWGDGQESEGLYRRIMATVAPDLEEVAALEDIKLPHLENIKHDVLDAYNRSVLAVVGLLVDVPVMLKEKLYEILFPRDTSRDEKTPVENSKIQNQTGLKGI